MDELGLAFIDTPDCSVSEQFDEFDHEGLNVKRVSVSDFTEAINMLSNGDVDMLAMPSAILHGRQMEMLSAGCEVVGARTPRRPNLVLVSNDKLDYQPRLGIILAESALVRRQLKRARGGLRILSPLAFASISEMTCPTGDSLEIARWMDDLREAGEIEGYITSRAVYDTLGPSARRHALLPDPKDRGGSHFLPLPYADLVILLARVRFPGSISKKFSETEGETCWHIQDQMISGLDSEMLERVGILVRHRQVRSLMKQAEEQRDITLEQACHDAEGEVTEGEVHVEFRIEVLSGNGRHTLGLDRIIKYSKFRHATISTIRDWQTLLREATRPVPKDFYTDEEAPAFIDLEE
ncbi:MAG: hypothetical protein ACJ0HH_04460 [Candidatus Thalassarchaeum sp.]